MEIKKTVDRIPLSGIDYVEFYVGNALQAAKYFQQIFGFKITAYRGLETGDREKVSYVLEQGKVRLVLTSSLTGEGDIAEHVRKHGDGVKYIALGVDNVSKAVMEVSRKGWPILQHNHVDITDMPNGVFTSAHIPIYGDTEHVFVDRAGYKGAFRPGYKEYKDDTEIDPVGLLYIDHMVGNVELGQMEIWVKFYQDVMGFSQLVTFDDKDISTEYSALMSKVMSNGNGYVKFPINEPAVSAKKKSSQIDEFLQYYNGPGVQHIALATHNIIHTVGEMRKRGVEFLTVPDSYYEGVNERLGEHELKEDIAQLKELNILIDADDEGYMLQIFTKPQTHRPTWFFEIIQRAGSKSFGKGNFKALFEAIEREQEKRGNL